MNSSKQYYKILIVCFILSLFLVLSGCSSSSSTNPLIGNWYYYGTDPSTIFLEIGKDTLTITTTYSGDTEAYTDVYDYSLEEDNMIDLVVKEASEGSGMSVGDEFYFSYKIEDDGNSFTLITDQEDEENNLTFTKTDKTLNEFLESANSDNLNNNSDNNYSSNSGNDSSVPIKIDNVTVIRHDKTCGVIFSYENTGGPTASPNGFTVTFYGPNQETITTETITHYAPEVLEQGEKGYGVLLEPSSSVTFPESDVTAAVTMNSYVQAIMPSPVVIDNYQKVTDVTALGTLNGNYGIKLEVTNDATDEENITNAVCGLYDSNTYLIGVAYCPDIVSVNRTSSSSIICNDFVLHKDYTFDDIAMIAPGLSSEGAD